MINNDHPTLQNTAGPMPVAPGYRFTDQAGRVVEIETLPTVSRPGRMRVIADEVNAARVGKHVPYRLQQIRNHYQPVPRLDAKPGTSWKAPTGTVWEVVRKSKGAGGLVTVTVRSKAGAVRHFTLEEVESWELIG